MAWPGCLELAHLEEGGWKKGAGEGGNGDGRTADGTVLQCDNQGRWRREFLTCW